VEWLLHDLFRCLQNDWSPVQCYSDGLNSNYSFLQIIRIPECKLEELKRNLYYKEQREGEEERGDRKVQ